jgi:hypothetical protein
VVAGESESASALARCTTPGGPNSSVGGPGGGTNGAAEAAAQDQGPGRLPAELPSAGDSLGLAIVSCNSKRDLPHLSVAAGAIAEAPASAAAQAGGGSDAGAKCPPAEGRCGASTGKPRLRSGAPQSADSWRLQAPGVAEGPTSEAVAPLHPVPLLQSQNRLLRHQCAVPLIYTGAAIAACCLIQRESLNPGRPWQGRFF